MDGFFFYQKRVPEPHPDWLDTFRIQFPSGRHADFPVVADAAGLAWIANLGCIELHTWHSRIDDVERPDYLLIDLDPSEGNPWSHVREIAMVVKEVMDELGLVSFPKTSGATGLHILAPIKPELEFPHVRDFAKALAKEVERRIDDQAVATTTWKVADRRRRLRRLRAERARPDDRVGLLDPADAGRARLGAAEVGRGAALRSVEVHARDDAEADRRGRRPHRRDVAAEGQPRLALRGAGPRSSVTVRSPGPGGLRTSRHVHFSGSLSSRNRISLRAVAEPVALNLVVANLDD